VAIAGETPVTYGELCDSVRRAGAALSAYGVSQGDRILIALPDSAEFAAAFFGAARIGAIPVPVNPLSRATDFAYYSADCGAALAIVHSSVLGEFLGAHEYGVPERIVLVGPAAPRAAEIESIAWEEWLGRSARQLDPACTKATDPAFFLYTSGSTGGPKAAVHQHKDMLVTYQTFAGGILQITESDRAFSVSKLYFAYGLGNGLYFPLGAGASTAFEAEKPRPDRVLALVKRLQPTLFFAVPTFYAALLREAEGQRVDFSSVRVAVSAGEALPAELFERFKKRFGVEILDAIGSTEMLHMFISNVPGKTRPGSCGLPLAGYDAQIVDEHGTPVPDGEMGNLWVRGGSAFVRYWNKPEKTAHAKRADGWIVTGDKFYRDADGYYFYCGRADDMMKVSGLWVSPAEVENALLGHAAVAEAAVVAFQEATKLLSPKAFVVLKDGIRPSPELVLELQAFVKQRITPYKYPRHIEFVPELPKSASGKVLRYKLRQAQS
jgi:benzoate-CoA ligase